MIDYASLSFDELRTLHREVGALIAQRRHEALEKVREQVAVLGFSIEDLGLKKPKEKSAASTRYRDPEMPENTWSGRGKHPAWLREKLEQGRTLDEFQVQ